MTAWNCTSTFRSDLARRRPWAVAFVQFRLRCAVGRVYVTGNGDAIADHGESTGFEPTLRKRMLRLETDIRISGLIAVCRRPGSGGVAVRKLRSISRLTSAAPPSGYLDVTAFEPACDQQCYGPLRWSLGLVLANLACDPENCERPPRTNLACLRRISKDALGRNCRPDFSDGAVPAGLPDLFSTEKPEGV